MNWYDSASSGWYEPNYTEKTAGETVKEVTRKPSKLPGGRKTRIIAIVSCICIAIASVLIALLDDVGEVEYHVDGMPKSWQDCLDIMYSSGTDTEPDYLLPKLSSPGKLCLDFAENGGQSMELAAIYDKCSPSIVGIKAYAETNVTTSYGWGTGMIVSSDGYIMTNSHVIENCKRAEVVLKDGDVLEAKLVGADSQHDIAILKIDRDGLTPVVFESSSRLKVGDTVAAIGNPISPNYSLTMTSGIVSATNRSMVYNGSTLNCIQTDASINQGNSGGLLINSKGHVVGITNMKLISASSGVEGMGFAIPSDTVREITDYLMRNDPSTGAPSIGIVVGEIPQEIADYYDIPQGLYVTTVYEKSGAAGIIKKGDIITEVNGKTAKKTSDISDEKDGLNIGDSIDFTVWRSGSTSKVSVTLTDSHKIYFEN